MGPLLFCLMLGMLFTVALGGEGTHPYVFGVAIGYIVGILHAPFYYPVIDKKSDPPSSSDQDPPIPPQPSH